MFQLFLSSVWLSPLQKHKNLKGSQNSENVKSNVVYNKECELKKCISHMLNKYRAVKSDTNRINMVKVRTDFKAEVRKFKLEVNRVKTKRLVDAKYKNAKEYWKLLKDATNINTNTSKNVSADRFAKYFKAINNPDDAFFFSQTKKYFFFQERLLNSEMQVMFSEVDVEITREEISKSIKQLKNGKSGGPGQLLNEFFIHGQRERLPSCLYTLLINF